MPISVHVAATPALAEMLKDQLLEAGIEATVAPAVDRGGWWDAKPVEVWIADDCDLDRARAIVTEFEKPAAEASGWVWRCAKCGETSEPQFTECWKCGASKA